MRRSSERQMDFIVLGGAKGVVAWLKPFESGKRQPTVRLLQFHRMLCPPRRNFLLPALVLCLGTRGKNTGEWHSDFCLSGRQRKRQCKYRPKRGRCFSWRSRG